MTHEIELEGYYPKILGSPMRMLCLGTKARQAAMLRTGSF